MIPATLKIKKPAVRQAISMRVIAMSVMTENTLAGSGGLRRCCSSTPDGLDYEPVIRSGHYLAGQEGFEPSTIRLTAERTTAVLLTLK